MPLPPTLPIHLPPIGIDPRPPIMIAPRPIDPLPTLAADVPIVLLPVRVETRWFPVADATQLELRIRVFPDEVHVAPPLSATATERADVAAYQASVGAAGAGATATTALYAQIVERAGASRAAWLVRALAPGAPAVADADADTDTDTTPAHVAALPERWIAIAKSATVRVVATGTPIATDLAAAPIAGDTPGAANAPPLGSALAWITDFAQAEAKGMALRLTMASAEAARLDELIVIGVRGGDPAAGSTTLGELIARHAGGDGAAFLPWGTSTNVPPDRGGARATGAAGPWRGAAARPLVAIGEAPTGDPALVLKALGLASPDVRDVVADGLDRDTIARAMHIALWPATWGYYLAELAARDASTVASARALYLNYVRPAGPLPALRLRTQPYGILPTTSLARWPATAARGQLAALFVQTSASWSTAVQHVPRMIDTTDVDRDLLAVLRRMPASRGAWFRQVLDADTASVALGVANAIAMVDAEVLRIQHSAQVTQVGLPVTAPVNRIMIGSVPTRLGIPFVAPASAARDQVLPQDYLTAIANAASAALAQHQVAGASPRTLLYLLARYAATHIRLAPPIRSSTVADFPPIAMHPNAAIITAERTAALPSSTLATTIGTPISTPISTSVSTASTVWTRLGSIEGILATNLAVVQHRSALRALGATPVGELETAFAGVLDSASHRLDAWSTAIASERLDTIRTTQPRASYVGGWAWLERPRPTPRTAAEGFLHAPSVAQARTAAVLRAGYEAHRADGPGSTLAIDLSSARVRAARWLLDGMRDGRPIGRLLGDHLERWLIDHGVPAAVHDVRVASVPAGTPLPELADGWALYHQWSAQPPTGAPLAAAYADLVALVDAVADLLLADSVHNALAGSPARSAAALDTLQRGEIATPDPRVDRTLTDGRRVQRRVVLMLPAAPGWPGATLPRAAAAPALEGFAARVLGNPAAAGVRLTLQTAGATTVVTRTLAQLGFCALDAVALAADTADRGFLDRARATADATATVTAAVADAALDELVLRAAALGRLFRAARAPIAGELGAIVVSAPVDRSAAIARAGAGIDPQLLAAAVASFPRPAPITAPTSEALVASAPGELASWLSDLGRVRAALEPLDLLLLVAPEALPAERRRTADGIELVVFGPTGAAAEALVLDGWSEAAPATEIATGVAFPHAAPRSQPAQAILIAVPPPATAWSLGLVEAILDETIARAKTRMVAPEDVRSQLTPATLVGDDPADLVPAIDFRGLSMADISVIAGHPIEERLP